MLLQEDLSAPLKIFYSYARADEQIRAALGDAVSLMRRQGLIEDWHDRKIVPGVDWAAEIDSHLDEADVVALLISQDFIASDYCFGKEMTRALARQKDGLAEVIPIIVRAVDLTKAPFAHLQYLPKNGVAIKTWPDVDSAYREVAVGIRTAVGRIKHRRASEIQTEKPATNIREDRRLDAAIAREIPLYLPREIAIQVRLEASSGLIVALEEDIKLGHKARSYSCTPADVRPSQQFSIPWSREELTEGDIELYLRLDAPGLENGTPEKKIKVQPFRDSGVFTFYVTASIEGDYHLTAQLLCRDCSLAERILRTLATTKHQDPSGGGPAAFSEATIMSIPLHTVAKRMTAVVGGTK